MRNDWTDSRLDDFATHVDQRFDAVDQRFEQVDQRFERLERRVDDGFHETRAEFAALRGEMNARFEKVDDRFEALQRDMAHGFQRMYRLMLQLGIGVGGTIIAALIGVIATQL